MLLRCVKRCKNARALQQVTLQADVERERKREEEASKVAIAETYDEVQAGIDADALFEAKLQQEKREEYTIEERAKFLAEIIAAQRKFRATQRSTEIRNDAVKDSKEAAGVHKQKVLEEPNSTKVEVKATKKSKRQKTDADLEEEEQLKAFLKIPPNEKKMNSGRIKKDGILRAGIYMKLGGVHNLILDEVLRFIAYREEVTTIKETLERMLSLS
ncbi:hypothetical protein Tco_0412357 [Tanacetum coccineum]